MATRGCTSSTFRDLKELVVGSHIFLPVETIDGEILPCIHVLCRSCIGTVSSPAGKKPGDKKSCEVCELEFKIPTIEALHKRKPVAELLLEFSKAANNIKPLCENNSCTWNNVNSRLASTYCKVCKQHECFLCADKRHQNRHQSVEKRSHWTEKPPNFGFCLHPECHVKQLEVFCIVCCKADCFMCLLKNLPFEIEKDFNKILIDEIQSLNKLSEEFCAIKSQMENQIQLEFWKKGKEKKIEADYKQLIKDEEMHNIGVVHKLKSFNTQFMKDLEQKIGKQTGQFDSSTKEHETHIQVNCQELIKAIESHRNSLLDQLKSVNTEGNDELGKKKNIIDAYLKTVDSYRRSCVSMQSIGKAEEKFCAVGAILKKVDELKTKLDFLMKQTSPPTSNESSDLKKSFKTEIQWKSKAL